MDDMSSSGETVGCNGGCTAIVDTGTVVCSDDTGTVGCSVDTGTVGFSGDTGTVSSGGFKA